MKTKKERVNLFIRSDIIKAAREVWPGQISRKCEEALVDALRRKNTFIAHCVECGELSFWRLSEDVAECSRCGRKIKLSIS